MERNVQRRPFKASDFLSVAQERRRAHFLSRTAAARAAAVNAIRAATMVTEGVELGDESGNSDTSTAAAIRPDAPSMPRRRLHAAQAAYIAPPLTVPEWALEAVSTRDWIVTARPSGTRALLVASGGRVRVRTRTAHQRAISPTLCVPGGGGCAPERGNTTLLVALGLDHSIWALDVLCWNGRDMTDACAELRQAWLRSARSSCGCAPRVPPCYPADANGLRAAADRARNAALGLSEQDGVLFYHRAAMYAAGITPVVLAWKDETCSSHAVELPYGTVPSMDTTPPLVTTLRVSAARRDAAMCAYLRLETDDDLPVRAVLRLDANTCRLAEKEGLYVQDDMQIENDGDAVIGVCSASGDIRKRLVRARVVNTIEVADGAEMQLAFAGVGGKWRRHADSWSRVVFQCRLRHRPLTLDKLIERLEQN